MLNFGAIIRGLRIERGLTQAEVGDGIGVSSQAISKWENENGLPDVTQLVPLADYFCVTLDYLLGHNPDKNEQEILAHIERLEGRLTDEGKWFEQLEENRSMLRKYPKDCRLMLQMCRILYYLPKQTGIDGTREADKMADELVEWGDRVLRESNDAYIRNEAVRWIVYTLEIQGKTERSREYAEMMPSYDLCKENLMQNLFDDDMERLKFHQVFGERIFRDSVRFMMAHAGWLKDET